MSGRVPERASNVGLCVVWAEPPPAPGRLVSVLRGRGLDVREAGCAAEAVAFVAGSRERRILLVLVEPASIGGLARALEVIGRRWPRVEVSEVRMELRARRGVLGPAPGAGRAVAARAGGGEAVRFPDAPGGTVDPAHLLTDEELSILLADEPRAGGGM
ncbi:MAG: hypothetical protein FJ255_00310 [Phycisphaerae bacterium]|nr:hypothetical protein [Phycisphaerae bacterium]